MFFITPEGIICLRFHSMYCTFVDVDGRSPKLGSF